MKKKELVNLVNDIVVIEGGKVRPTKKLAEAYTNAVFAAIHQALANGENVAIQGHGEYEIRERDARKGRNPQTGEEIDIPATVTVGFRPTGIKNAVKVSDVEVTEEA